MSVTDANRPLRVLDKVLDGGLGIGNIGVLMARHGMGKVAVLTSMAIDHALDERNTLHVAVGKPVSSVRAFHDEVIHQILRSLDLPDHAGLTTRVERHKQIYSFPNHHDFSLGKLAETLGFLQQRADFRPEMIEISGWPEFGASGEKELRPEALLALRTLAQDWGCEVWITAHTHRHDELNDRGIPLSLARHLENIEVLIGLEPEGDHVALKFLKTHGAPRETGIKLEFDPNTMLLRWA